LFSKHKRDDAFVEIANDTPSALGAELSLR